MILNRISGLPPMLSVVLCSLFLFPLSTHGQSLLETEEPSETPQYSDAPPPVQAPLSDTSPQGFEVPSVSEVAGKASAVEVAPIPEEASGIVSEFRDEGAERLPLVTGVQGAPGAAERDEGAVMAEDSHSLQGEFAEKKENWSLTDRAESSAEPFQSIEREVAIDALVDEFLGASEEIAGRPGGTATVQFPGTLENPGWFEALQVTKNVNPLLDRECRREALSYSVDELASAKGVEDDSVAVAEARDHLELHRSFARDNEVSYSDYLREVGQCKDFCAPLVASLASCQVAAVSQHPHGILLFDFDSDEFKPEKHAQVLEGLTAGLERDESARVVLVGRASRVGDLLYNRSLAARRALAVRDRLLEAGLGEDRITTLWFGWEPPQISPWIAREYGLEDLYTDTGSVAINQSVMIVLYSNEPDSSEPLADGGSALEESPAKEVPASHSSTAS